MKRPEVAAAPLAWSIGVAKTTSVGELSNAVSSLQPVLTWRNVSDCKASFVADPFLAYASGTWQLFFEVFDRDQNQGNIAVAESVDGLSWQYHQVVLDEPFHLSYPQVFKHAGSFFMIPESRRGGGIRLYQATDYPRSWRFVKLLISGDYADPSIVYYQGKWWIFAVEGAYNLAIFYSSSLLGPWHAHAGNPHYVGRKDIARPGGRIIFWEGKLLRFAQDNVEGYGKKLRAFVVDQLTEDSFVEHEMVNRPFLSGGSPSWRAEGMHQCDPWHLKNGYWLSAVDGYGVP